MTQSYDKETCTLPQSTSETSLRVVLSIALCSGVLILVGWLFTEFVSVFAKTIAALFGLGV